MIDRMTINFMRDSRMMAQNYDRWLDSDYPEDDPEYEDSDEITDDE